MRKIFLTFVLSLLTALFFTGCSESDKDNDTEKEIYEVTFVVSCEENLILSTYDVQVFIDDKHMIGIEHGESGSFTTQLEEGSHEIVVQNADDEDVDGFTYINVEDNGNYYFSVKCENNGVDIDEVDELEIPLDDSDAEVDDADDENTNDPSDALTISVVNCPEFAEIVENGIESVENKKIWEDFLVAHSGETLEFSGTITDWYDKAFWVGVSFSVAVEDNEQMIFHQNTIDLIKLGMTGDYHYNNYHSGLITEGMRVHVITEIKKIDNEWNLEIDSIQVIE